MEVASDRLLDLMEKGISVAQVARVADAFTKAGIMVHAYLMYGFPTETDEETIESLERVRQLFEEGVLQSAFWHRFTATRHSPVGLNPKKYGITITGPPQGPFANNDLTFTDPAGCDPEDFGPALARAVYNYMHGSALDTDVRNFFDFKCLKPRVPKGFIRTVLRASSSKISGSEDLDRRIVWLGGNPSVTPLQAGKVSLLLPGYEETLAIELERPLADWLQSILKASIPRSRNGSPFLNLAEAGERYPKSAKKSFQSFLRSKEWKAVRAAGLLLT